MPARTLQYWRTDDGAFLGRFASPQVEDHVELRCGSLPELVAAAQRLERVAQAHAAKPTSLGKAPPERTYVALVPITPPG